MVYLSTSDEWQRQSALLLQARPTTTRITTKYNMPNLATIKSKKRAREGDDEKATDAAAPTSRAVLTLKTYDPESGVVLKFKTDRAAEVGRLIGGLGRLGRHMAALPPKEEVQDVKMEDAPEPAGAEKSAAATSGEATPAQPSSGGGKKKKKGKK